MNIAQKNIVDFAKRRLFAAAAGLLVAGSILSSPAANAAAEQAQIAVLPAIDAAVLYAAENDGLFEKEGINVKIVPFKSALELTAAMRAGRIAGHYSNLMTTVTQRVNGIDSAVVVTTWHTSPKDRAFGLALSPATAKKIANLDELKKAQGVTTARSSGTITDRMLDVLIENEKVADTVLKPVEVSQIPIRLQMLNASRLDSALFYEPLLTLIEKKGGRVVWDDRGLDKPLSMVALRKEYLKPEFVLPFRRALAEAARRIDADPEKYRPLIAKKGLLPPDIAQTYVLPKFSGFATEDGLPPLPTRDDVKEAVDWLVQNGLIKKTPELDAVVYR
ncbi:MAG: ABC transporter substrate-binding protein [Sutterellaceae bacterium]|nr:ABC transporter substrate-binding protein [Sutterellaceae bacterium]